MENVISSPHGLLILHGPTAHLPWSELRGTRWWVLSFVSAEDERRHQQEAGAQGVEWVGLTKAAGLLDAAVARAREKYCDFVAEWPERFHLGGRTFKEAFTDRGELSYWWLTYASQKHNESTRTFEYLCHLEVIREVIEPCATRCVFVGADSTMALLVQRSCGTLNVPFLAPETPRLHIDRGALRGLVGRLSFLVRLSMRIAFFRLFYRRPPSEGPQAVAFYTLFPTILSPSGGGVTDRNYRDFPSFVAQQENADSVYFASFVPGSWRDWLHLARPRSQLRSAQAPRVLMLDSYLRPSDVALAGRNLLFYLRYLRLDRADRSFRGSFQYDGIDIYELIGAEFARALLSNQLPTYLLLSRLIERAVQDRHPTHVVCFLDRYVAARAVYFGAKRGDPGAVTIAYQHASITRMKLWHVYRPAEVLTSNTSESGSVSVMPSPDRYLFQGEMGLRVVLDSGYERERCTVTGSPRYDALGTLVAQTEVANTARAATAKSGPKTILVLPSLSDIDAQELVEACAQACSGLPESPRVLVKPYPSSRLVQEIPAIGARAGLPGVEVTTEDLYHLIGEAGVVLVSSSTTGDEAIALGCPVVCYSGLKPNLSSFADVPAAPVAHDPDELRVALERMLADPEYLRPYQAHWAELVRGSFHVLDGRAQRRMLDALLLN